MQNKLLVTLLLCLICVRCGCDMKPDPASPQPTDHRGEESLRSMGMEEVGKYLQPTIQKFKNNAVGLCVRKNKLFQLVTQPYTEADLSQHGEAIKIGKFSIDQSAQKKVLEEEVLSELDFEKNLTLVSNQPMAHAVSTGDKIVFTTNFGDHNLFGFYASGLFAQDEIQVAEMPHLAMVKYYYEQEKKKKLTSQGAEAFILTDVPRYVDINTQGIYGNAFATIPEQQLETSLQPKLVRRNPPTKNHIISIAAPNVSGRAGTAYDLAGFSELFLPAYCAYQATQKVYPQKTIQVETGNWGAGAFGNDLRVSAIAQLLAAAMLQIHLAVYPFSVRDEQVWKAAIKLLKDTLAELQAGSIALTPKNIFERAQKLATDQGNSLKAKAGNGT